MGRWWRWRWQWRWQIYQSFHHHQNNNQDEDDHINDNHNRDYHHKDKKMCVGDWVVFCIGNFQDNFAFMMTKRLDSTFTFFPSTVLQAKMLYFSVPCSGCDTVSLLYSWDWTRCQGGKAVAIFRLNFLNFLNLWTSCFPAACGAWALQWKL